MVKISKLPKRKPVLTRKSSKVKKKIMKKVPSIKETRTRNRYSEMSVDEFLNTSFDEASTGSEEELDDVNKPLPQSEEEEVDDGTSSDTEGGSNQGEETHDTSSNESEQDDSEDEVIGHKESLAKLKDTDPEFYKFLEENDKKLLDFNLSDSETEANDKEEDDDEDEDKIHKPTSELEVASDESDFEVRILIYTNVYPTN